MPGVAGAALFLVLALKRCCAVLVAARCVRAEAARTSRGMLLALKSALAGAKLCLAASNKSLSGEFARMKSCRSCPSAAAAGSGVLPLSSIYRPVTREAGLHGGLLRLLLRAPAWVASLG
jgi:hypothetical protein